MSPSLKPSHKYWRAFQSALLLATVVTLLLLPVLASAEEAETMDSSLRMEVLSADLSALYDERDRLVEKGYLIQEELKVQKRIELVLEARIRDVSDGTDFASQRVHRAILSAQADHIAEVQELLLAAIEEREREKQELEESFRNRGLEDDLGRLREAQELEESARRSAVEAREREERERDQEMRRLLGRERALAEEIADVAESQTQRIRRLSQERRESAELFASRRETLTEARGHSSLQRIDAALLEARTYRRAARGALIASRENLRGASRDVEILRQELLLSERELQRITLELGPSHALGPVPRQQLVIVELQTSLGQRRLQMALDLEEELERQTELQEERVQFFQDIFKDLFESASREARREVTTPFADENWSDLRAGIQVTAGSINTLLQDRVHQIRALPEMANSAVFWGWVLGLFWRGLLFGLILWFLHREGTQILRRTLRLLFRRPFFRTRAALVVRSGKVLQALLLPTALVVGLLIVADFLGPLLPEVRYFRWIVEIGLYFLLPLLAARALAGRNSGKEILHVELEGTLQEGSRTIDRSLQAGPKRKENTRRSLQSLKTVLVATLLYFYAPLVVWEIVGPSPLWSILRLLTALILIGTVYFVLSHWRDEIAEKFSEHASKRAPKVAAFVEKRKTGPFSVSIIGLATVALVLFELVLFFQRFIVSSEAHRQITNFLFRKKIELQQRNRENHLDDKPSMGSEVPEEYQRYFQVRPLWDETYQLPRQALIKTLDAEKARWLKTHRQGSVALVGEAGVGKTTLLNQGLREGLFEDLPRTYLTITEKITTEKEIIDLLVALFHLPEEAREMNRADFVELLHQMAPRFLIFDACQHLYLRKIGGFTAINFLLEVVHLTSQHHFWVLSFTRFAWNYLNRVRARGHYFGKVISLGAWSEEEIKELIRDRDAMIDLDISFSELVVDQEGIDTSYEVIRTSNGYFRLLHEYTHGNPEVALVYWLRSLHLDENRHLQVGLFNRPGLQKLQELQDPYLFTLAAIAQHGGLGPDEVAKVINSDRSQCETMMGYLEEAGVISPLGRTGRYRIRAEFLRPVIRQLSISNFLYE